MLAIPAKILVKKLEPTGSNLIISVFEKVLTDKKLWS